MSECWSTPTSAEIVRADGAPIRSAITRAGSVQRHIPRGTPIEPDALRQPGRGRIVERHAHGFGHEIDGVEPIAGCRDALRQTSDPHEYGQRPSQECAMLRAPSGRSGPRALTDR